ncbi:M14 family metallopeptidase [Frankia sp. AgKG'84/4]|uniref:M14 family metallopeptidase n=1 Tax=Frankia sp. AgKG'84/4 TaxID=573490 RepID=UPI00200BA785|nr:M14 family metallopeptidase [Frankia sp. AgKG'84/4]MCL9795299.1 M14 family metallopeptidase [Frankia sp. AgKG'84/4]
MYFSASYGEARQRFLAAAGERGAHLESFRLDTAGGARGEALSTDVARLGASSGPAALVLVSGTHGTEGFAGSACQLRALHEAAWLADLPVVLVHALNPFGFSYRRRVNEDNIDINRNFIDHDEPPGERGYGALHPFLLPADWEGPARAEADAGLFAAADRLGLRAVQQSITGGQYTHADGLFYGGAAPCWSNRTWHHIIRTYLTGYERVAYIDLHTGLGERAAAEPIFRGGPDEQAPRRARRWYGEALTDSDEGTASSTPIGGNSASALVQELVDAEITAITCEFGTLDGLTVLRALQGDNWLWQQPEPVDEPLRARLGALMREAFDPPDEQWRADVLDRGLAVINQAAAGVLPETADAA